MDDGAKPAVAANGFVTWDASPNPATSVVAKGPRKHRSSSVVSGGHENEK